MTEFLSCQIRYPIGDKVSIYLSDETYHAIPNTNQLTTIQDRHWAGMHTVMVCVNPPNQIRGR